jgi:gluconolactonase
MHVIRRFGSVATKLSPSRNPEWSWCFSFFPALLVYISVLMKLLNSKPTIGYLEALEPTAFHKIFPKGATIEIIATGSTWSEGPLWVENDASCDCSYLLFSDTISNRISRWETGKGLFTVGKTLFIEQSGCNSNETWCNSIKEPGSNGLLRYIGNDNEVTLLACAHGEREISVIFENGTKGTVVSEFNNRRLNSPNDLVMSTDRHLYFTDPPFGLYDSSGNSLIDFQQGFSGVYMIHREDLEEAVRSGIPTSKVKLLDSSLTRPNGIAFSPDFSKLYVSNCDEKDPFWKSYDVLDDGTVDNGKIFYHGKTLSEADSLKNYPDGFKIDTSGNLLATGPGGIVVLSPKGALLGRLRLDRKASNVELGDDGFMYITASDAVFRVRTNAKAARALKISL